MKKCLLILRLHIQHCDFQVSLVFPIIHILYYKLSKWVLTQSIWVIEVCFVPLVALSALIVGRPS